MSRTSPADHPEGQDEVGNGEAVMVLQGSWTPNEVTEDTGYDDTWGFFPWPAVKNGTDGTEGINDRCAGLRSNEGFSDEAGSL